MGVAVVAARGTPTGADTGAGAINEVDVNAGGATGFVVAGGVGVIAGLGMAPGVCGVGVAVTDTTVDVDVNVVGSVGLDRSQALPNNAHTTMAISIRGIAFRPFAERMRPRRTHGYPDLGGPADRDRTLNMSVASLGRRFANGASASEKH